MTSRPFPLQVPGYAALMAGTLATVDARMARTEVPRGLRAGA